MSGLRMVALGVGDAFSALYYSTALALVVEDGRWLLVDCPHPIRKVLREASLTSQVDLKISDLAGVALTHLHADHVSGLEGLGFYNRFELQRPDPIPLLAGPLVAEQVQKRPEADCFSITSLADRKTGQAGPFRVQARQVKHGNMQAYAFRIDAAGRTLGHSGDTVFDPELVRWLSPADSIVHEAGARSKGDTFHTCYEDLLSLPADTRAKMRLAHYSDSFDIFATSIEPLRQGWVYEV